MSNIQMSIEQVLKTLLAKNVHVTPSAKYEPTVSAPATVAVYVDANEQVVALMLCSMPLSAYFGAALSLVPAQAAESDARRGKLSEGIFENFQEVANICAQVVASERGNRCHLLKIVPKTISAPAEYKALCSGPKRRFDAQVHVPGYGDGSLSFRLA